MRPPRHHRCASPCCTTTTTTTRLRAARYRRRRALKTAGSHSTAPSLSSGSSEPERDRHHHESEPHRAVAAQPPKDARIGARLPKSGAQEAATAIAQATRGRKARRAARRLRLPANFTPPPRHPRGPEQAAPPPDRRHRPTARLPARSEREGPGSAASQVADGPPQKERSTPTPPCPGAAAPASRRRQTAAVFPAETEAADARILPATFGSGVRRHRGEGRRQRRRERGQEAEVAGGARVSFF